MTDCTTILGYLREGRTPILCIATSEGHTEHVAHVRQQDCDGCGTILTPENRSNRPGLTDSCQSCASTQPDPPIGCVVLQ